MREAFQIAQSGRPGPVLIDIPKDVTAAMCEFSAKPASPVTETYDVSDADLKRIAAEINAANCPVIYYGGGVIASGACSELVALMHKADIPATGTIMSIGSVPAEDPLYLGMIGMHGKVSAGWAIDRSDLLLSIGTRFSDRVATNTNRFNQMPELSI